MRIAAYFLMLSVLLAIPVILFTELSGEYVFASGHIVRAIASAKDIVSDDIAFLGELTPAVAATFVAALAPRPMSKEVSFPSLIICVTGYLAYLLLGVHLGGKQLIFDASLLSSIETLLDGYIISTEFDSAVSIIKGFAESIRIYYLVLSASIVGFAFNSSNN